MMVEEPFSSAQEVSEELVASGIDAAAAALLAKELANVRGRPGTDVRAIVVDATREPGKVQARSFRLRNWVMNWKAVLFEGVPNLLLAAHSESKYAMIGHLLLGLKTLIEGASMTIGERETRLLIQFWDDGASRVSKDEAERKSGWPKPEFENSLNVLLEIGAIDIDDDEWIYKTELIYFV
jgi:hypothetical protein